MLWQVCISMALGLNWADGNDVPHGQPMCDLEMISEANGSWHLVNFEASAHTCPYLRDTYLCENVHGRRTHLRWNFSNGCQLVQREFPFASGQTIFWTGNSFSRQGLEALLCSYQDKVQSFESVVALSDYGRDPVGSHQQYLCKRPRPRGSDDNLLLRKYTGTINEQPPAIGGWSGWESHPDPEVVVAPHALRVTFGNGAVLLGAFNSGFLFQPLVDLLNMTFSIRASDLDGVVWHAANSPDWAASVFRKCAWWEPGQTQIHPDWSNVDSFTASLKLLGYQGSALLVLGDPSPCHDVIQNRTRRACIPMSTCAWGDSAYGCSCSAGGCSSVCGHQCNAHGDSGPSMDAKLIIHVQTILHHRREIMHGNITGARSGSQHPD
jgi:hypothetical protein